jgi:hypothetical protein
MPVPANFREFADQCVRLAENARGSDDKIVLLRMAHAWRDLATEEERLEQLIREADEAFAGDGEGGFAKRLALAAGFAARRAH